MKTVSAIILGAGGRGYAYACFAKKYPEKLKIVGVAEPRDFHRAQVVNEHKIPAENVARDWKEFASRPKFADAVVIATQDSMHADPVVAFAKKGYAILLEKPMAPTASECHRIVRAVEKYDVTFAVCHLMRYTNFTKCLKRLLDAGVIGDLVSMQHLEPVGYWHQAHSFVRGNWRNEKESSFMLLAKSCHDLDWIRYIMGVPCKAISSFGSLFHFRKEQKPKTAGARCVCCGYEPECPYSALRFYMGRLRSGQHDWPLNVLTPVITEESVMAALKEGPYGRCVYECDNDVVDNQVVNMLFDGGRTATFTMTGFNEGGGRRTSIFGTRGAIYGDSYKIRHYDFLTEKESVIDAESFLLGNILDGHMVGNDGVMESFIDAIVSGDKSKIISGPQETLESHLMVFAAEDSRLKNTVIQLK